MRISRCAVCGSKPKDFGDDVVCVNPKCRISDTWNVAEWNAFNKLIRAARKQSCDGRPCHCGGAICNAIRRFDKALEKGEKE